jgi:hypothetical protein
MVFEAVSSIGMGLGMCTLVSEFHVSALLVFSPIARYC